MPSDKLVVSKSEQERIAQIRAAVESQFHDWFARFTAGVRYTPGVARTVAEALIEFAVVTAVATDNHEKRATDEHTAARCQSLSDKLMAVLDAELFS